MPAILSRRRETHVNLSQAGSQPRMKNIGPSVRSPVCMIPRTPAPGPFAFCIRDLRTSTGAHSVVAIVPAKRPDVRCSGTLSVK